jgi:RNA 3'-terminal phosphate cyclase (ATP)
MQDQLIIFMALAKGSSSMLCGELTLHTRTALSIAEQLLPVKCRVTTSAGGKLFRVQCTGAGVVSNKVEVCNRTS